MLIEVIHTISNEESILAVLLLSCQDIMYYVSILLITTTKVIKVIKYLNILISPMYSVSET